VESPREESLRRTNLKRGTAGDALAWAHLKARRSKSRHPSPVHCRVRSRQAEDDARTHGLLPSRAAVSRDSTSVLTLSDRPDPAFPVPGWCHTLLLSRRVRYCRGQVWRGVCMAGWTRRHGGRASAGGRRRGRRRGVGGSEAPGTERRRRRVCVRPGAAEAGLGAGWARKRTHRAIRRRTHAVCVGWRRDDVVVNEGGDCVHLSSSSSWLAQPRRGGADSLRPFEVGPRPEIQEEMGRGTG
jgi:hypothetical protein